MVLLLKQYISNTGLDENKIRKYVNIKKKKKKAKRRIYKNLASFRGLS